MFPRLGLTCAALLVFAACGGGDEAVSTTLPLPPETLATLPAESTEVEPVESTSPTTTSTSSTTTTTTTTVPVGEMSDLAAAIQRDLNAGEAALLEAGLDPGSQHARDLADMYFTGPALAGLIVFLDDLVADGLVTQPNDDIANSIVLTRPPELANGPDSTSAAIEMCRIDAAMIVEPSAVAGGQPFILNDTVATITSASTVVLIDGIWKLQGGRLLNEKLGVAQC